MLRSVLSQREPHRARRRRSRHALAAITDATRSDVKFGETHTAARGDDEHGSTRVTYSTSLTPGFWIPAVRRPPLDAAARSRTRRSRPVHERRDAGAGNRASNSGQQLELPGRLAECEASIGASRTGSTGPRLSGQSPAAVATVSPTASRRPASARDTARRRTASRRTTARPRARPDSDPGFAGFCAELSYIVLCTIFVPAGICFGVASVYVVCQLKSYFGTDSSSSSRPSGYFATKLRGAAAEVRVRRQSVDEHVAAGTGCAIDSVCAFVFGRNRNVRIREHRRS